MAINKSVDKTPTTMANRQPKLAVIIIKPVSIIGRVPPSHAANNEIHGPAPRQRPVGPVGCTYRPWRERSEDESDSRASDPAGWAALPREYPFAEGRYQDQGPAMHSAAPVYKDAEARR